MKQRGFIVPLLPVSRSSVVAAVITALVVSNVVFFALWKGVKHEFHDYRVAVELAQQKARAEVAEKQAEQERVSREIVEGWSAAVDWYRRNPRIIRVREPAGCTFGVSPVSRTSVIVDAAREESAPSASVDVAECEEIANNAILDAAQLTHIQVWLELQREKYNAKQK